MLYNYFNGSFYGLSNITYFNPFPPKLSSYDKVTFYSGDAESSGCIIDKVYGLNKELTKSIIDRNSNLDFKPKWTPECYILCEFNNNLSGGNITNITMPITKWDIYRAEYGSNILTEIKEIGVENKQYIDYTALKNKKYKYYVFAKNDTEISAPLETEYVDCYYHGWYLIDIENNQSYLFDINFNGGDLSLVENMTEYETNLKYKAYSKGNMNYFEGSISALVMTDYCSMEQTVETLEKLKEFIFSSREKYLKDNKGRIFKVFTYGYKDNFITNGIKNEPRIITFSFKEAGEV